MYVYWRKCAVLLGAVLCSWIPSVAHAYDAFAGSYSVPASPVAGTVLLREFVSSATICGEKNRPTCTLIEPGASFVPLGGGASLPGPLIPTAVTGISVQMLVNGVPLARSSINILFKDLIEIQLVADGRTITGGSLNSNNPVGYIYMPSFKEFNTVRKLELAGKITSVPGTCSVPSQNVTLPSVTARKFDTVGSMHGTQRFQLRVNSCPKGYNQVGYSLRPVGGAVAGAPGVLPLSADSTASGVKIFVADDNGAPVNFGQSIKIDAYDKTTGGSYAIPTEVSYIQTDAAVTTGTVNAAMAVTLEYR
ncbi:fimbrial protein [Burkholderia territorii]|nr:fimbrial protein [Burkholderia territorii]